MRIITIRCPDCGTIVAANVLEAERVMKCPRLGCEEILGFDDLDPRDREYFLDNKDSYRL